MIVSLAVVCLRVQAREVRFLRNFLFSLMKIAMGEVLATNV